MDINKQLQGIVASLIQDVNSQVEAEVSKRIANFDINKLVNDVVKTRLEGLIKLQDFPDGSIPLSSIKFDESFRITGDQVKGGIIENFGSTGIEDRSTKVQMTVMDQGVAFETALFAPSMNVRGKLTVDGDLIVKGEVPEDSGLFVKLVDYSAKRVRDNLNEELFRGFSSLVHKQITETGIDLTRVTQNGKEIVRENQLGYHIIDTNIQRLGQVRDLQTVGDTLLSDTLYASGKRAGVNTIDPSAAFVVWDEEVEMIVAKKKQDVGYIGTARRQSLIIGSNNKDNIKLEVDGSTHISNLVIGKMKMSSAAQVPNYEGQKGEVVWNENPSLGGPMGWVCLGGTLWANFGIID